MEHNSTWISVTDCAKLYGKSRKWVDNRIQRYNITTQKADEGNKKLLQIVDFIAHCGEPPNNTERAETEETSQTERSSTPEHTELLQQENLFLSKRIADLEKDIAERQKREERLTGIIERQTLALPKPDEQQQTEQQGVVARFAQWVQGR